MLDFGDLDASISRYGLPHESTGFPFSPPAIFTAGSHLELGESSGGRVCLAAEEFARALNSRKPSTMPRPKRPRPPPPGPGFTHDERNPRRRRRTKMATSSPPPADAVAAVPLTKRPRPPPPAPGITQDERNPRRRRVSTATASPAAADAVAAVPPRKDPPPGFNPEEKNPHRPQTATKAPVPAAGAATPAVAPGGGDLVRAFGRCRAILDQLLCHEDGWVFSEPVDARALGLLDYYISVQNPMDLGTVLHRLVRRRYADPYAFADDVRLTFRNALSYNNKGDPVYNSALELSEIFEAGWARALPTLPPPTTDVGRRARFKDLLPLMPPSVQELASAFLRERGACLAKENLEMETDLDKADAATLDELDRLLAEHLPSGGQ